MKHFLLLFALLYLSVAYVFAGEKIRVACVGNSITYGANIHNREKNSYPAQLQAYMGDKYEVRNLGVSGTTMIAKGDHPYVATASYREIFQFQPQIILIKLGTNDTKPQNWCYKEEYLRDYQAFIDTCRKMESAPRIILLTPVRCYLPDGSTISAQIIENDVRPLVEKIAFDNQLEVINLFNAFGKEWQKELFPDKLHPSSIGAGVMARKIALYLMQANKVALASGEEMSGTENSFFNFHGYEGRSFRNEGAKCFLVKPRYEAEGKPWVMRARFWGHEPQTDIALLENGFHIAYCDVADLYGSPEAVKRWNKFYKRMRKAGFNERVVLEGMSRGGLILYNWAAENPKKVACIYADAPVLDIKSWPMGEGQSAGSAKDTERLLAAYKFKDKKEALSWNRNPVDRAGIIAKHRIPVLHVVGDADEIVPVAENTALFEKELMALNAPIRVIRKPGIGHHPHSLYNPQPIVDYILGATGRKINTCTIAAPGNEFRAAAGWKQGCEWHAVAEDISQTVEGRRLKLLLLGNSITQGWGGNRKNVTYKPGKEILDNQIGVNQWESAGISGDRVQNLLWRIRFGNYTECQPENVIISIGINNLLGETDTPEEVAEGILGLAREAVLKFPESRIVLLGPLPAGKKIQDAIRVQCNRIHDLLSKQSIKGVDYVNPTSWFVDETGEIGEGLYGGDYIHLSANGYQVWAQEIGKLLTEKFD
ncbi:MAG: GDSL-type esterase/lipase family protein [Bacteroidales bacterium]